MNLIRAIVVNSYDPSGLGRIQVRIPSLHGVPEQTSSYIDDEFLPWAISGLMSSGGNQLGSLLVPSKGTTVLVGFEDGDESRPIYFGGVLSSKINNTKYYDEEVEVTTPDNYQNTSSSKGIIYQSLKGAKISFDDTSGELLITNQSGKLISMSNDGVTIRSGNASINLDNDGFITIITNN